MKATLSENIKQEDEEVKSYPLQTEKVKIIKSSDPFR
jgi:hypothetical protein